MSAYDIILRPILSEKSYGGIANKIYTFEVAKKSNKTAIKIAIEDIYKVKVEKVNTINMRGQLRRMGKNKGYTSAWKKAVVKLSPDSKSIEFFDSLQ
jgi:large subunit ribosomal protein L23